MLFPVQFNPNINIGASSTMSLLVYLRVLMRFVFVAVFLPLGIEDGAKRALRISR